MGRRAAADWRGAPLAPAVPRRGTWDGTRDGTGRGTGRDRKVGREEGKRKVVCWVGRKDGDKKLWLKPLDFC